MEVFVEKKKTKHLGVYGLVINDNKILLIKKVSGPYDGKFDLPGGSIEFGEDVCDALKREFREEVGIDITSYELYDVCSCINEWNYNGIDIVNHHIGIFYKVSSYENEIKSDIDLDDNNDDSLGAFFIDIDSLKREDLSNIAIVLLERLGYFIK